VSRLNGSLSWDSVSSCVWCIAVTIGCHGDARMPKQLIIEETELTHTALVIVLYNVVTPYLTVQCCHALPHGVTCNHGSAGLAPVLWSALSCHSLSRQYLRSSLQYACNVHASMACDIPHTANNITLLQFFSFFFFFL